MLLGDFNAKVKRRGKPTIGNESLHEITNDKGVRVINFDTPLNITFKSIMFPHRSIYKCTWASPEGKTQSQIHHIIVDRQGILRDLMFGHSGQQIAILTTIWWWKC
jgi:hypothetical protein